ncbi:MAG TPA: transaldolase [Acidimicrobiales bacterium]|nr:transaldolase [Acidimicrobiales bacterium]
MTRLIRLYEEQGQSPWLDNLTRHHLSSGRLRELIGAGVRGVTSNPTIFQKAIEAGEDYDEQFAAIVRRGSVEDAYWELVVDDVTAALDTFEPMFESSAGQDGFVSIEVSPAIAHDTAATERSARALHERIDRRNLLVKIPATAEGVPAIRRMIAEGRSINITLIFGLPRYEDVIEAYLSGLEELVERGGDPSRVHSVASFFVSRVDTEVDRRLKEVAERGDAQAATAGQLAGKVAVAQARLAYQLFRERFSGDRWEALAAKGANLQRPLWASTSTKNPAYPDLLYVDSLIGPHTVNTMPDATLDAFLDHGTLACTVDHDIEGARQTMAGLGAVGIDIDEVAKVLEDEGVASFTKSFDELMQRLTDKANALR